MIVDVCRYTYYFIIRSLIRVLAVPRGYTREVMHDDEK